MLGKETSMKIERKRGNHSVSNALPSRSGVDKLHADLEDARASKRWPRALPVSRVRRELASIIRRRECILIERHGEAVARLVPVVTIEDMNAAIRRRGASAGVLAGAPVDFAASDDESLLDGIDRESL